MWEDEIVNEVRRVREDYATRFHCDLDAIYNDLKQRERVSGRKIVAPPAHAAPDLLGIGGTQMASTGGSDAAAATSIEMQQVEMVVAPQIQTEGKPMQRAQHVGQGR